MTQGLDFVVEKVDAHRLCRAHREYVDQRAADGKLAVLGDLRHAQVAGRHEGCRELVMGKPLAGAERQRAGGNVVERRQALQQRRRRNDGDAAAHRGQLRQHGESLRNDVLVGRKAVPGQRFPFDEVQHREIAARKEAQLGLQLVGVARIVGQQQYGHVDLARKFRDGKRRARPDETAPAGKAAGRQRCGYEVGRIGHGGRIAERARDYSRAV